MGMQESHDSWVRIGQPMEVSYFKPPNIASLFLVSVHTGISSGRLLQCHLAFGLVEKSEETQKGPSRAAFSRRPSCLRVVSL